MTNDAPLGKAALAGPAAFLPIFEAPGFEIGQWSEPESSEPGLIVMPFFMLSSEGSAFHQALYDLGWIRANFNWGEWKQTPEASRVRDDPAAVANATPDQLAKLLTTIARGERFCEGTLKDCHESGLLVGILRRARTLCDGQH